MSQPLTEKQESVFNYIAKSVELDHVTPTFREICKAFGFKSPQAAANHMKALKRKGYLDWDTNLQRVIRISPEHSVSTDSVLDRLRLITGGNFEVKIHANGWRASAGVYQVYGESLNQAARELEAALKQPALQSQFNRQENSSCLSS